MEVERKEISKKEGLAEKSGTPTGRAIWWMGRKYH
jgi:hypothetical protein